jgi:hypothetical protein
MTNGRMKKDISNFGPESNGKRSSEGHGVDVGKYETESLRNELICKSDSAVLWQSAGMQFHYYYNETSGSAQKDTFVLMFLSRRCDMQKGDIH